jgi:RNA polymerase sigma factor (TIGR02999 family)
VNEVCVCLLGEAPQISWENRTHFLCLCANLVRRTLINHARRQGRIKRGGEAIRVSWSEAAGVEAKDPTVVSLEAALLELEKVDARKARVVELRFFGGLDVEETAEALETSTATVVRDWSFAKAWLHRQLAES